MADDNVPKTGVVKFFSLNGGYGFVKKKQGVRFLRYRYQITIIMIFLFVQTSFNLLPAENLARVCTCIFTG